MKNAPALLTLAATVPWCVCYDYEEDVTELRRVKQVESDGRIVFQCYHDLSVRQPGAEAHLPTGCGALKECETVLIDDGRVAVIRDGKGENALRYHFATLHQLQQSYAITT